MRKNQASSFRFAKQALERGDNEKLRSYIEEFPFFAREMDCYLLRKAVYLKNPSMVKYLISKGADVHSNNDEAINMAKFYGADEIVSILEENA